MKEKTPEAFAQSRKVKKKKKVKAKSFNSWIDLSIPSKVCAFRSLQMSHIRQWRIILQSTLIQSLLNLPDQFATSSTTLRSITQWTPNSVHTIFHNSWATWQCRSKCSTVSPFLLLSCSCNTNPSPPLFAFLDYQLLRLSPKLLSK